MANVPRSEPSTGPLRVRRSRPGLVTTSDVSDDTSSARDDGLAWFKTAFGAFVYDKGYRQAFSMLIRSPTEYLMALSQLGSPRES